MPGRTKGHVMADEEDVPLENSTNLPALRPQGTQLVVVRPGSGLVSRIAGDVYRHLPGAAQRLRRVGVHELNEQSYRQVIIWLNQVKMAGWDGSLDQFCDLLFTSSQMFTNVKYTYLSSEGKITTANLENYDLDAIDLSHVPHLTHLWVPGNRLIELALSHVTGLTNLWCSENQLRELNLSPVPKIKTLWCYRNLLTELNISDLPNLEFLWCSENPLGELDLSQAPKLSSLRCLENQLTDLDLSHVPELTYLACDGNQLTNLDLSYVPELKYLSCSGNQLTQLDIRGCVNSNFTLSCDPHVMVHKRADQIVKNPNERH